MPKGRIGLSLDEDVLAILNEYGRAEMAHGYRGQPDGALCVLCLGKRADAAHNDTRPWRYEIVQTAIREWAARQKTIS